jgi:hypothetical protein
MKKSMFGILLSATMALFSCGKADSAGEKVVITGNLQNAPNGVVVLSQYTDSRPKVLDTLEIKSNGDFTYEFDSIGSPTFYELNLYGQRVVKLALFK